MFVSKNAVGLNYTDRKNQDVSLVIDIDNKAQTFTVYRMDLKPLTTSIPENIPEFVAEMIGCAESAVMADFKDFVDAVASAIHS